MGRNTHRIVCPAALALGVCVWAALAGAQEAAPQPPPTPAAAAPVAPPVAAPPAAAVLPAVVHCGRLLRVDRVTTAVAAIDAERAAAAGHLEAGTGDSDLVGQRSPGADLCFAVAVFEVQRERSLSRFDYRLDVAGKSYDCLGLGVGEAPFDARRRQAASAGEVRLLFEVPVGAAAVHLVPALVTQIPMREVRDIVFGTAAPAPAAPAPEPAPAALPAPTPAVAAPAAVPVAEPPKAAAVAPAAPAPKPAEPVKPPAKKDALEF